MEENFSSQAPELTKKESTHPYADKLQENLKTQRRMEVLLTSKISTLSEILKTKTDTSEFIAYTPEENLKHTDYEIQKIKAEGELNILKRIIQEKVNYYKQYMVQFEKDIAEVETKFKNTVSIAQKSTKPNVIKLLSEIKWDKVDNDDEVKIAVYKQLKKHV